MTETPVYETFVSETAIVRAAQSAGLTVLAQARWPQDDPAELSPSPGFVYSSFSPLVAATAGRCLAQWYGAAPLPPQVGRRVALVLVSVRGHADLAPSEGGDGWLSPLLFSQSANAVLGHIATGWGICGPLLCTSPVTEPETDALALASGVLALGDADTVLVVLAEPACAHDEQDWSHAVLVRAATWPRDVLGRGA